jgi:dihydroflavonol-4-reductase
VARIWLGGASGFLGSQLLRALLDRNDVVAAVASRAGQQGRQSIDAVDAGDEAAVERSAKACELAFYCVGRVSHDPNDAERLYREHVECTRKAFTGLMRAGVSRVVYVSTSGTVAVGEDSRKHYRESDPTPTALIGRFPYYRTKAYAEQLALSFARPGHFEVVVVNPSLLLGPGDLRGSSTSFIGQFLEGKLTAVPAGGLSFVDVRDVATAMIAAARDGQSGARYLLGAANWTFEELFARLSRLSGVPAPLLRVPPGRAAGRAAHAIGESVLKWLDRKPPVNALSAEMAQCFWYCDSSKAERELGFKPRDPNETLLDTVIDLVERGRVFPRQGFALRSAARAR